MSNPIYDLRIAARSLFRVPTFAIGCVLCLAIGLASTTTMLEVADMLLLRPPSGIRAPGQVMRLMLHAGPDGPVPRGAIVLRGVTYSEYEQFASQLGGVDGVVGYHAEDLTLGRGVDAIPAHAAFVTGNFFSLLGASFVRGRGIDADGVRESVESYPVVLSHALWRRQFGADVSILGKRLTIGKGSFIVSGIAAESFRGIDPLRPTDLWIPMGAAIHESMNDNVANFVEHSEGYVELLARVSTRASGAIEQQAVALHRAALAARFGHMADGQPVQARLAPLSRVDVATRDVSVVLWMTGMAIVLLVIGCANVVGLFTIRALGRRRELAVRYALGASRWDVFRLAFVESILIAGSAGLVAILLRYWGRGLVKATFLPDAALASGIADARILMPTFVLAAGAAVACALPSLGRRYLADLGRQIRPSMGRLRTTFRRGFLATQIALATTLVASATLFVASWRNVQDVQLGFTTRNVLLGQVLLFKVGYRGTAAHALYDRMASAVRALPGVGHVALASRLPFTDPLGSPVTIPGVDPERVQQAARSPLGPELNAVTPEFFDVMGIRLARGRLFTIDDRADAAPVVIINRRMARVLWPNRDPIGQCIGVRSWTKPEEPPCSTIVGVVEDTRSLTVSGVPDLQIYIALAQHDDIQPNALIIQSTSSPSGLLGTIRRAMQGAAPGLPFADVRLLADHLEPELRPWRLAAEVFTFFGAVALVLAGLGLYSVFGYIVAQRTKEVAIRSALGADQRSIAVLVLGEAGGVVAGGALFGFLATIGVTKVMVSLLVGVSGVEPAGLMGTIGFLAIVALVASGIPAIRAMRIDRATVLRAD